MSQDVITGIVQGGALVLLALVLHGLSKKIDALIIMTEKIVMALLNKIGDDCEENTDDKSV